jgi:hypothetical protein
MGGKEGGALQETLRRDEAVKGGSNRSFGLVFSAVFAHGGFAGWWWLGASGAILAIALAAPKLLAPANRLWLQLGRMLIMWSNHLQWPCCCSGWCRQSAWPCA